MSKELEALEDIILYLNASEPEGLYCKNIEIIEAALKALEIINYKCVNVGDFIYFLTVQGISEKDKKDLAMGCAKRNGPITQSEFDLLKEMLL